MAIAALSSADLAKLENGLKALSAGSATAAAAISPASVETEFCTIWPKAQPILKIVAKYVAFIPGVGGTAAAILNGLVTAGDTLSGIVCPKSS